MDRGPGLPAGEIDRIFSPFYRTEEAQERASGHGLGLAEPACERPATGVGRSCGLKPVPVTAEHS